jgi:hypothetical protein
LGSHFESYIYVRKNLTTCQQDEGREGVKWELGFAYFWHWDSSVKKDDGICTLGHRDLVEIWAGKWG